MTNPATAEERKAIYDLILEAFTPQELRRFCRFHPNFEPLLARFGDKYNLTEMADEVMEYCHTRDLWDSLLAGLKEDNPHQYRLFQNRLPTLAAQPTPTPSPLPPAGELPEPGTLPPGSRLPFQRNALFTGRSGPLLALARALLYDRQSSAALVSQAVQGLGGVGKSQLAIEFAYRYGCYVRGVH